MNIWRTCGCTLSLYTNYDMSKCHLSSVMDSWCHQNPFLVHNSFTFFSNGLFVIWPFVICFITASLQGHLFLDLSLGSRFLFRFKQQSSEIIWSPLWGNWFFKLTPRLNSFFFLPPKTQAYGFCSAAPAEVILHIIQRQPSTREHQEWGKRRERERKRAREGEGEKGASSRHCHNCLAAESMSVWTSLLTGGDGRRSVGF